MFDWLCSVCFHSIIVWWHFAKRKEKHDCDSLEQRHNQCDQIGRFSKVLGEIFCFKSSPNAQWLLGSLDKRPFSDKNRFGNIFRNFWKYVGYFWFQHLVTLATILNKHQLVEVRLTYLCNLSQAATTLRRHSSVVSFAPSILHLLQPWVLIPSTPSMLLHVLVDLFNRCF